jgi:hypothetical protein
MTWSQRAGRQSLLGIVGVDAMSNFEIILASDMHLRGGISKKDFAVSYE